MSSSHWMTLLRNAQHGRSIAQIARELGVSRTSVSLLLAGKYPGKTDKMAERIIKTFLRTECPYLGREISADECADHSGRMPTSSPTALRHWRACQECSHRRKA